MMLSVMFWALPVRLRGMDVYNPSKHASDELTASLQGNQSMKSLISEKNPTYPFEVWEEQLKD